MTGKQVSNDYDVEEKGGEGASRLLGCLAAEIEISDPSQG